MHGEMRNVNNKSVQAGKHIDVRISSCHKGGELGEGGIGTAKFVQ
jgi:hypothetical protein